VNDLVIVDDHRVIIEFEMMKIAARYKVNVFPYTHATYEMCCEIIVLYIN
jgi:hypothetical protein